MRFNRLPLNVLLILIAALLTLGIVARVDDSKRSSEQQQVRVETEVVLDTVEVTLPRLRVEELASISARPAFDSTRRPFVRPAVVESTEDADADAPNIPLPDFRLVGISESDFGARALVSIDGAPPRLVREGENLQGWLLTSVGPGSVTFERGSASAEAVFERSEGSEGSSPSDAGVMPLPPSSSVGGRGSERRRPGPLRFKLDLAETE